MSELYVEKTVLYCCCHLSLFRIIILFSNLPIRKHRQLLKNYPYSTVCLMIDETFLICKRFYNKNNQKQHLLLASQEGKFPGEPK